MKDGTVEVKFYGCHNHDCQDKYAVNFVNPIECSDYIGNMVDTKLLAGMTDYLEIRNAILDDIYEIGEMKGTGTGSFRRCERVVTRCVCVGCVGACVVPMMWNVTCVCHVCTGLVCGN